MRDNSAINATILRFPLDFGLIYLVRRGTLKSGSSQLQRVDAGMYPRITGNVKKKGDFQESLDEYSACDETRCGCLGAIGE